MPQGDTKETVAKSRRGSLKRAAHPLQAKAKS